MKLQAALLFTLIALFVTLLNAQSFGENNNNGRLSGYLNISGHNYYIDDQLILWDSAVLRCEILGMKLVSIETFREDLDIVQYFINNAIFTLSTHFWTSGCYISKTWMWTGNGELVHYFDWVNDIPPSIADDTCITLTQFGWENYGYDRTSAVLCE